MTCENCGRNKSTEHIEEYRLCKECVGLVIRCEKCNKLLGMSYEDIIDSSGRCQFPELFIHNAPVSFIFCDNACLRSYVDTKLC